MKFAAGSFALAMLCSFAAAQDQAVPVFGTTVVMPAGLKGQIYNLRRNTKRLPNFTKMKPVGAIYTPSLNVPPQEFDRGFPGVTARFEWFAIDFQGRFWIENPGIYRFVLTSDDGAKLYIDDKPVIDNDGQHAPETKDGSVTLAGGAHRLRVSYFQGPRLHVALILQVSADGDELRIFNTDEFKRPSDSKWPFVDSDRAVTK